jgi:hypothetical protein
MKGGGKYIKKYIKKLGGIKDCPLGGNPPKPAGDT